MLAEKDIEKLSTILDTKVTLIEDRLVDRFSEVFATKSDVDGMENRLIDRMSQVFATKADMDAKFQAIHDRLDGLEYSVNGLMNAVDKLVARVEMLNQEYLVLKERDTRYERWFHEIATKVGVTLTP